MNATAKMGWPARLLIGLLLITVGAATAVWALARYDKAAQFLGVTTVQPVPVAALSVEQPLPNAPAQAPAAPAAAGETPTGVAELEARLARVERTTQMAAGSSLSLHGG
jgi:hypothetical protein